MAVYSWVSGDALDTSGSGMRGDFDLKKELLKRRKKTEKKKRELAARAAQVKREQEAKLREESRKAREEESIQKALKKQMEEELKADVERLFADTPVVLNADMRALLVRTSADDEVVGKVLKKLAEGRPVSEYTGDASPETVYIRLFQTSKSQNGLWEELLKSRIITEDVEFNPEEFLFGPVLPTMPPSDALLLRKPVLAVFWRKYIAYRIRAAQAAAAAAAAAGPFE